MFSKILIANRGEIACRIIKTARRMGIKTVAVHSEADADALFVDMVDEAVAIGPAAASESYLRIDKIIAAALATGAQAVHPGYGFLSERASFADALDKAGIAFIGPNAKAIAAMGDKIESKKLASAAGVSTVPGHLGVIADAREAVRIAEGIGFPVMIKASAGGGGKGMRIAHSAGEVEQGFASSMNEARAAFGDDRVFIEKFVTEPRHIEIQVLADKHGHAIYLGERECSIQRRNQKVIEEAPSPFLDAATRKAMGVQAVALARAVGYDSAGTVEFIVDGARNFYFLEMNTRLQVEHAVTELVTGLDLVEQMIRIAAGEKLELAQSKVKVTGWAIESRIYAEDPYRNFLPSIGRLTRYRPPAEGSVGGVTVRNDTGVYEGSEISIHYDPMIAKLCTHAPDRLGAIDGMIDALNEFDLSGIANNIPFLSSVMAHARFREGRLTTGFIAEEFPQGFKGAQLDAEELASLVCVALQAHLTLDARLIGSSLPRSRGRSGDAGEGVTADLPPPSLRDTSAASGGGMRAKDWVVALDDVERRVSIRADGDGIEISFGDPKIGIRTIESAWRPGERLHRSRIDGHPFAALIEPVSGGYRLRHGGALHVAHVRSPRTAALARLMPKKKPPDTARFVLCPMPGRVVEIDVAVGQEVKAGEPVAIVEAMKMENVLKAERDGTVKKIHAKKGQTLAVDEVILEFA